ncbi:MAG: hypothetical protein P9L88_03505 [Candidatus Tantalella remota]|nr:hypothetical protein [Candidatus Tantalella remota]
MSEKYTKEQEKLFDIIIRSLGMAIKNSALYDPEHPICKVSIENLKTSLERWLPENNDLELGISQDRIFLGGEPMRGNDERCEEVATYLHQRGVVSLTFLSGITGEELTNFFQFIKQDRKTVKEMGGVLKNVESTDHLKIREVDYSALLQRGVDGDDTEEDKVWQFLFTGEKGSEGDIAESKEEFIHEFLDDSEHSAEILNKIYKDAVNSAQDEETAQQLKENIVEICKYYEKRSSGDAKQVKVKLTKVISRLNPGLIDILFEKTVAGEEEYDLAEEITSGFSDDFIAGFIESLISNEDTFNENLLKVFDKLAPKAEKSDNVVSMVADKLFSKRIVNPATLSKMQTSIKDIFKTHPESNFMSQLYKITVDSVVNKKIDTLVYVANLAPVIRKFEKSIREEKLKKEEIWLLLNILWLENDSSEFGKFGMKVVELLPELLDLKDMGRIREIMEFFTDRLRPEQRESQDMEREADSVINNIATKEMKDSIISFIPEAASSEIDDIADIFTRAKGNSPAMLVDAFLSEKNPAYKNKFRMVFSSMKEDICREVIDRIEYSNPFVIRDLFGLLKEFDPSKAHLISKKMISSKNPQVRWEALEVFEPGTEEEREVVFDIFVKESDKEVKRKAAAVLLKTRDAGVVDRIFSSAENSFFMRNFLLKLVELCGYLKLQESLPHLKKIFQKRPWFNTKYRDDLRVAAVTSLRRLNDEEAMELLKTGLLDRSSRVRRMCEIVMELDHTGHDAKDETGEKE